MYNNTTKIHKKHIAQGVSFHIYAVSFGVTPVFQPAEPVH